MTRGEEIVSLCDQIMEVKIDMDKAGGFEQWYYDSMKRLDILKKALAILIDNAE